MSIHMSGKGSMWGVILLFTDILAQDLHMFDAAAACFAEGKKHVSGSRYMSEWQQIHE